MVRTISHQGRVVIPTELRKKYNLMPCTEVVIVDYGGVLSIIPARVDPITSNKAEAAKRLACLDKRPVQRAY